MLAKIRAISPLFLQIVRSLPPTSWLMILGLGLFIWLGIFGHNGLADLEHLIRLKKNYSTQKEALVEEKEALEQELKNLDNPRYLKHLIHQELGFIESDKVIIQFHEKKE